MNMGRLLRSLSALVVLVAVVVGAPIALWVLGRGLLPAGVPSLGEVWEGLTTRDTGGVFLGLLVIVGFIAWAVFTVCVVLEIVALLAGRRRAWRIPMLRVPQSAATALISVILTGTVMFGGASAAIAQSPAHDLHQSLSAGTAATAEGPAVRVPAAAPGQQPATSPPAAAAQVPAAGPVWTVARYDTFWGIADKTLGDGRRYQEIVALNVGVAQADGGAVQDSSTNLEIGWQLRLPADAAAPADSARGTGRPGHRAAGRHVIRHRAGAARGRHQVPGTRHLERHLEPGPDQPGRGDPHSGSGSHRGSGGRHAGGRGTGSSRCWTEPDTVAGGRGAGSS